MQGWKGLLAVTWMLTPALAVARPQAIGEAPITLPLGFALPNVSFVDTEPALVGVQVNARVFGDPAAADAIRVDTTDTTSGRTVLFRTNQAGQGRPSTVHRFATPALRLVVEGTDARGRRRLWAPRAAVAPGVGRLQMYVPGADDDGDGLTNQVELLVHGTSPDSADTDLGGLSDLDEIVQGSNPFNQADDVRDSDGDGLSDADEVRFNTDPRLADTDSDGLIDPEEIRIGSNPRLFDTDRDGLGDGDEVARRTSPLLPDTDGDTVSDFDEVARRTDPTRADSDADGLDDGLEAFLGTDPLDEDSDGDGLTDGAETFDHFTDATLPDTDLGGLPDGREVALGLDPLNGDDDVCLQVGADADADGLANEDECFLGTSPRNPDTDADELGDATELALGTDPSRFDTDFGGLSDGLEVQLGQDPLNPADDIDPSVALFTPVPTEVCGVPFFEASMPVRFSLDQGGTVQVFHSLAFTSSTSMIVYAAGPEDFFASEGQQDLGTFGRAFTRRVNPNGTSCEYSIVFDVLTWNESVLTPSFEARVVSLSETIGSPSCPVPVCSDTFTLDLDPFAR